MFNKTFFKGIAATLAILGLFAVPSAKANAADMTPISTNTTIVDSLSSEDDVNYYSFEMDKNGYFQIYFAMDNLSANCEDGWKVSLQNTDGSTIASKTVRNTAYTSVKYDFKKGTKLLLRVEPNWDLAAPTNVKYNLMIASTTAANWQAESNDTFQTANTLKTNTATRGNLLTSSDVDYFKYTVQNNGKQIFSFKPEDFAADPCNGWKVSVYKAASNELLFTWEGIKNAQEYAPLDFKKGTKLLIKIEADWDLSAPVGQDYIFKIAETSSSVWERENLLPSSVGWSAFSKGATPISIGAKMKGTLWNSNDEDLFSLTLKDAGYVKLQFAPGDVSTNLGDGYELAILDSKGATIEKKTNVLATTNFNYYLAPGTYYIKANANWDLSAPVGKIYNITAKYTKFTPAKVASVKAKKATISWKKQDKISGYEIQYGLKKSFAGAKSTTTSKNTKSLKLKKGKTYYVRVRAYKKTKTGKKVYGSWSSVVKTKK